MNTPPPPPGFELVGGDGAIPPPPPGFEPVHPVNTADTFNDRFGDLPPAKDAQPRSPTAPDPNRKYTRMEALQGLAGQIGHNIKGVVEGLITLPQRMGEAGIRERTGDPLSAQEMGPLVLEGGGLGLRMGRTPVNVGKPVEAVAPKVAEAAAPEVPPPPKGFEPVPAAPQIIGKLPEKGVAPANIAPDGKIYVGEPNTSHFEISEKYAPQIRKEFNLQPGEYNWKDVGFVTPDGRFLDRKQAFDWVTANEKKIKPSENMYGEKDGRPMLDALDYRDQVPASQRAGVPPPPPGFEPVQASSLGAAAAAERAPGTAALPPSYEQAVATVGSRIGEQPKPGVLPKDLVAEVIDDLNPVARAEKAAGADTAALDPTTSPYMALRLTRGSGGKVEQMLQHGTFDFNTLKNVGPSFVDAVKPIAKQKDEFKAYLLANRDLELEQRGIPTGVDSTASQAVVKGAPQAIKTAAEKLGKYQDDVLQYAVDSGIVSKDAAADMRAMNRAYVPFYRVMDDGGTGPFPSRGFQTGRPTSLIKGSERQIADPLESVIRNTQTFIQKSEHNRALKVLEDFSNAHPEAGILKPVKAPVRPIEIQPGEIQRIVDDLNLPSDAFRGEGRNSGLLGNETATIFRRSDKELPENVIQIFHDGKPKLYEVDPEIARSIKGMDNVDMGNFLRILGAPSRALRAGVVLDPTYMARNFIRDQFSAGIQSKNNYYPVYDFAKGIAQRVTHGEQYQNWLKAGGAQAALMSLDRSSAAVKLASKYGRDPTLGGRVKNVLTSPLDVLRVMSQIVDEGTRIGEFMQATKGKRDNPAALQKGAFESREVTTDFAKHGRDPTIRALGQISEFMNASMQGTAREAQAVKRQTGKTAAVTAAAITLPSVYLWIQNHNDPRYKNAPSWEKDAYWLIMPSDPKQEPWRIPKPFTFGMLGGSLVERTLDKFVDSKPEAFKGFGKSLAGSLLPNYIPTVAKPFIEQFSNRSLFTERPIEPERLKNVPPSERYTEQTPEVLKKLGKGVAAVAGENSLSSPLMLQNYIRDWGGTLGQNVVSAADAGYRALGLSDRAPAPTKGLADVPVIRAFVSRYPSANAQPIQDFYEKNQEIEQKVNARREALKRGDAATAKTYEEQVGERTAGIKKQLDAGHREVRRIQNDKEMHPNDKAEAIKQEYLKMIDRAQKGLEIIRQDQARRELRQKPAVEYKGP